MTQGRLIGGFRTRVKRPSGATEGRSAWGRTSKVKFQKIDVAVSGKMSLGRKSSGKAWKCFLKKSS